MFGRLRKLVTPKSATVLRTVEQREVVLTGREISYTLKRSNRRRSIGLRIDGRGLTVSMPHKTPEKLLSAVLQDKALWVIEKLDNWQAKLPDVPVWEDGAGVPYLGELLTLRLSATSAATELSGGELKMGLRGQASAGSIEKRVVQWYKARAQEVFAARVAHYAALLGVSPSEVKISRARTQWGSCTTRGVVRLNLKLIELPMHLIDYVVAHELAHMKQMNHSPAFWRVVESVCPDYARLRLELKTVGLQL